MERNVHDIAVKSKLEQKQLFKISRFKEVIKRTKPHKHDAYFELIYLSEGAGFHWVDTEKYQITPPVVFFLSGQLHYWEMTAIPKGFVMLFRDEFFNSLKHRDLLDLVASLQGTVCVQLTPGDTLDFIFAEMEKEYADPSVHSIELMQGYLQVALVKLVRQREQSDVHQSSGGQLPFRRFQQFLRGINPVTNVKVNQAADHLGLSPQNLNAVCRRACGKSASEMIVEQVILEAKRYLLHTDKNVTEIAFMLDFSDSSHLIKYFRKATGETPQGFRSRHFQ